jgi:hypothetical protein
MILQGYILRTQFWNTQYDFGLNVARNIIGLKLSKLAALDSDILK